jgi:hypothetical protein
VTIPHAQIRPLMGNYCVREGMHPKTNACSQVSSQLGTGHDTGGGSVDPVADDGVRGTAGADRRDDFLVPHVPAGRVPRSARVCCGARTVSLDRMIVAASTTLMADSRARSGRGAAIGAARGRQCSVHTDRCVRASW